MRGEGSREEVRWVNKWKGVEGMNGKGWLGR